MLCEIRIIEMLYFCWICLKRVKIEVCIVGLSVVVGLLVIISKGLSVIIIVIIIFCFILLFNVWGYLL